VYAGVDALLFHLLILGCLSNSTGYVWRKAPYDHYIVETMPQLLLDTMSGNVSIRLFRTIYLFLLLGLLQYHNSADLFQKRGELLYLHRCFEILPNLICRSPEESLNIMRDVKKPSGKTC